MGVIWKHHVEEAKNSWNLDPNSRADLGVIKWDVTMLPWEPGLNKYLALFLGIVHAKKSNAAILNYRAKGQWWSKENQPPSVTCFSVYW